MSSPLVSIITPSFNSAKYIEETVNSVLAQAYQPIEYVVMDGGSTDNTLSILEPYRQKFAVISEADRGQTDAINKGWKRAQGDILTWLNADDLYLPDTVQTAVAYLDQHPEVGWVYGYSTTLDANGNPNPFRHVVSDWDYDTLLRRNNYVIQPSVFLRRQVITEFGYLDETLHYGMDYEYWLRIGRKYPGRLVPGIRVNVKWYRETKSASGGKKKLAEIEQIIRQYGGNDLPSQMHHEWAEAYLSSFFQNLAHGHWSASSQDIKALRRYPAQIPHGLAKLILRVAVPPALETRLRQALVKDVPHV